MRDYTYTHKLLSKLRIEKRKNKRERERKSGGKMCEGRERKRDWVFYKAILGLLLDFVPIGDIQSFHNFEWSQRFKKKRCLVFLESLGFKKRKQRSVLDALVIKKQGCPHTIVKPKRIRKKTAWFGANLRYLSLTFEYSW